ncbi:Fe-S-containing hydro-lyase [Niameybacter massiliensis]|uniref:Fe-S-containing hydro-lyase n=1 Tax=Holtiella tumoricola TaxID=3018743 RepID=A0AA42J0G3_9FIRM|nr:Fe-S-containing hydro-lyase [Holtiella tumoricola]MDA3731118.1 Fe-S-containing hydro-lyase [Holtiella tumoricola]
MTKHIQIPMTNEEARTLKAGERVLLTGTMYTARDAAHKRIVEEVKQGKEIPISLKNVAIYYAGPAPAKPGQVIGSCGPTTSGRMDAYAPWMMEQGQTVMIGKGLRNQKVIEAMKEYGSTYLTAIGGAGALLSKCVKKMECVGYAELGAEAIYKLEVEEFPVIVTIDSEGNNLYIR